jgi:hypothetical protein
MVSLNGYRETESESTAVKLQRPSVIIDTVLDPKPKQPWKQPLPAKKWICVNIYIADSGTGGENFHENSLPSRDPRGAKCPYFCSKGCIASVSGIRRVKLRHALAATSKKIFQIF